MIDFLFEAFLALCGEFLIAAIGYSVGYLVIRGISLGRLHVYDRPIAKQSSIIFRYQGGYYVTRATAIVIGWSIVIAAIITDIALHRSGAA